MNRVMAPVVAAAALALFAAPASAQDDKDSLQKLVEKLSKQVEQLEKKVGDLGKQLEKALENQKGFDFGNLMERFNEFWNDMELEKYFGDFQVPDLNEMFEQLREQFGDQFGNDFDLEDYMQQFRDRFGGFDMEQMMEELRRMFEQPQDPDDDGDDFQMALPVCLN